MTSCVVVLFCSFANAFFHTSSLVQFVTNYGIFHAWHKSTDR